VHQHEVALSQRCEPGPDRFLPAFAAGLDDHGLARVQGMHLALRVLEPARRTDDHDPVHLVQG
jgi:hypothetical protein